MNREETPSGSSDYISRSSTGKQKRADQGLSNPESYAQSLSDHRSPGTAQYRASGEIAIPPKKTGFEEDTEAWILQQAREGQGAVKISNRRKREHGESLSKSRVQHFLERNGLGTAKQRAGGGIDILPAGERLCEETKTWIIEQALAGQGAGKISAGFERKYGRAIPKIRVQNFLERVGLSTAEQRAAGRIQMLTPQEEIPPNIKVLIRERAREGRGATLISSRLRLEDGRGIPRSRVESFLYSEGFNNGEMRKSGGIPMISPREEIPPEAQAWILDQARAGQGAVQISSGIAGRFNPGISKTRVQSFLDANGLGTARQRAAGGIEMISPREELLPETEARIIELARRGLTALQISDRITLQDGRGVRASRIKSILERKGLDGAQQRSAAGREMLTPQEKIPPETEAWILAQARAGVGAAEISRSVALNDGRGILRTRVRSFLDSAGWGTAAERAEGGRRMISPQEEIPPETEARIRALALAGHGASHISRTVRLPDGRGIRRSRVRNLFARKKLNTEPLGIAGP